MKREILKWAAIVLASWTFVIGITVCARAETDHATDEDHGTADFYDLLWWIRQGSGSSCDTWWHLGCPGGCGSDDVGDPPPGGDGEHDDGGHEGME